MVGGMMVGGQKSQDSRGMGSMSGMGGMMRSMTGGGQESKDLPRMGGMGSMGGGADQERGMMRNMMGGGQESKDSPRMGGMDGMMRNMMGVRQESKDSPPMGSMKGMMGGGQESKDSPRTGGMMGMMGGGMKGAPTEDPIKLVEGQFVPLFDGKSLFGWSDVLPNGSHWEVIDGILEGRGGGERGKPGLLLTNYRDFKNFQLRVTARYPEKGAGRIEIRHTGSSDNISGYQVSHGANRGAGQPPAGSIGRAIESRIGGRIDWDHKAESLPLDVDQWYTIEITAIKNRITTSVDGKSVLDFTDTAGAYTSGRIAVICFYSSHVQIKEILIKKLSDEDDQNKPTQRKSKKSN